VGSQPHFVQTIRGRVTDSGRDEVREMLDRWVTDLAPGAEGWLGTTAGVAADGTFFAAARFATAEQARANSDRPEQNQWWMETAKLFDGEVTFGDCDGAETFGGGGSDDAGFVQVITARVADVDEMRRIGRRFEEAMSAGPTRDDVIGGLVGVHDGDRMVQVVYFTSEDEARRGEASEMPPEVAELMAQEQALMSETTYIDIADPWTWSPR